MKDLPPIADEIRQASKHRVNVNLKPRAELTDEAIEAGSRALGEKWGSAVHLVPKKTSPSIAPLTSVRFDCPSYLDKELSVKAAEEGVTKTYLILKALAQSGFRLDDVDLVKDRRRLKRQGILYKML